MTRRSQRIRYREARAHAIITASVGWLFILAVVLLGGTHRSVFGPLKWTDFVHFYTLGDIAHTRDGALLYDRPAQHQRQVSLIPESEDVHFEPVYAPQTALLFAPFSLLPYLAAGGLWALVTMASYAWALWASWRPVRLALPDHRFVIVAALAFPPVLQLPTHGQTTAVALLAFAAGWMALEAGRPALAGLALSLLAIKPQFGLVLAAVALLTGEWRVIGGGILGLAAQILAVVSVFGPHVLERYARVVRHLPQLTSQLEPQAHKMHSLTALTRLIPEPFGTGLWAALGLAIVGGVTVLWWRTPSWRLRFGALTLASVLVNPHLTIYDATVAALPIMWIGGWLTTHEPDSEWFWQRVYWVSAALLIPTAVYVKIQLSALLMAELFAQVLVRLLRTSEPLASIDAHPS